MLNPYILITVLVAGIFVFGLGMRIGGKAAVTTCQAEKAKMVADSVERKDAEAKRANAASRTLEVKRAKAIAEYDRLMLRVDEIASRPEYRAVCLDPDGLRAVNAALAGSDALAGQPDRPLPGPAATGGRVQGNGPPEAGPGR